MTAYLIHSWQRGPFRWDVHQDSLLSPFNQLRINKERNPPPCFFLNKVLALNLKRAKLWPTRSKLKETCKIIPAPLLLSVRYRIYSDVLIKTLRIYKRILIVHTDLSFEILCVSLHFHWRVYQCQSHTFQIVYYGLITILLFKILLDFSVKVTSQTSLPHNLNNNYFSPSHWQLFHQFHYCLWKFHCRIYWSTPPPTQPFPLPSIHRLCETAATTAQLHTHTHTHRHTHTHE